MNVVSTTGTVSTYQKRVATVAIGQLQSSSNKLNNLICIATCAAMAKQRGARMLLLPECFGYMGESSQHTLDHAEPPINVVGLQGNSTNNNKNDDDDSSSSLSFLSPPSSATTTNSKEIQDLLIRIVQQRQQSESPSSSDGTTSNVGSAVPSWKTKESSIPLPSTAPAERRRPQQEHPISLLHGLQLIAKTSRLWISGGGMHESGAPPSSSVDDNDNDDDDDDGKGAGRSQQQQRRRRRVYNSHVIVDDDGNVRALYRKIHLFDVDIPNSNGLTLCESSTTAPGTTLVVCDSPIGKLGIATCYDVRFPEMFVDLVQNGGAQVILVPSAFTVPTGSAHWHILLRARAIENQCYVLAAAQYGRHNAKRESYGHSLAVDPWGRVLADAGGCDGRGTLRPDDEQEPPTIITCDIDLQELESIRQRMPIQKHRDVATFTF